MEVIRSSLKRENSCDWCPVRIKANHIWVKKTLLSNNPLIRVILNAWNKDARMRLRLHAGSYMELRYQLLTFGFPSDSLPYSMDGEELTTNVHQRWLSRRMKKECMLRSNAEFKGLDLPGYRDVCLGRGSAAHQHAGNLLMKVLMSHLIEEYRDATAKVRKELNKKLIQKVRDGGGRFLAKTNEGWYKVVDDEAEIEKKVGGSFRGMIARTTPNASLSSGEKAEDLRQGNRRLNEASKRPRLDIR